MNRNDSLTAGTSKTNIRAALIGAVISAAMAVALPQLLHMFGMVTGLGPMPGETFLPMHLPVMLCGFFAGPAAGLISGAASPAISAALTGMPAPLKMIAPAVIWNSIIAGLPGIAIQLIVIPAAVYAVNRAGKADSDR